jgi:hypothetical protein
MPDNSGPDSAFFRIITSVNQRVEGKEVHPGPKRARIYNRISDDYEEEEVSPSFS